MSSPTDTVEEALAVYDPALLTTFLAVAETRSFTGAGLRLGISQPTVSQHVGRLEKSVGRLLVTRDTREVRLTDAGDAMAGFARTILAAHAAAESYFSGSAMRGRLRFGAADGTRVAGDAMVWIGQEKLVVERDGPVPLIVYQAPSISRQLAIDALEAAGRTWRITCNTRDVNGVLAAVRAGMGVAVFPFSLIPTDLVKVSTRFELPDLGDVDYVLVANPAAPREPVDALTSAIMSRGVSRMV